MFWRQKLSIGWRVEKLKGEGEKSGSWNARGRGEKK